MASERYVALGLARVRMPWFGEVARWATSGVLAMDFVKTVSVDEVRSRLESGRPFSVLLIDGGIPGIDRDLLERAVEMGCAPVVVRDGVGRDWTEAGAVAELPIDFGIGDLEAVITEHATPIGRIDDLPGMVESIEPAVGFRARTVAVTGAGGVGRSTVATAIAQGAAATVEHAHTTVLADLSLHADLAMLHDARDVIPGLLELVDSHRSGSPGPDEVRKLTFDIVERRYRLLLGLRRHRDWTALRPRALRAAIDGLCQSFTLLVADVDADLEGEAATGSMDVEERNLLARTTIGIADVVVVVGRPGIKGLHSMLRVVRDCVAAGVPTNRVVPVVNLARRGRAGRTETTRTVHELLASSHPGEEFLSPVFCPERRGLDDTMRDGVALPRSIVDAVTTPVLHRLDAIGPRGVVSVPAPEPVRAGSLGTWDGEATA